MNSVDPAFTKRQPHIDPFSTSSPGRGVCGGVLFSCSFRFLNEPRGGGLCEVCGGLTGPTDPRATFQERDAGRLFGGLEIPDIFKFVAVGKPAPDPDADRDSSAQA